MTMIQIGVGLYLVGFVGLSGLVVTYLTRTPAMRRIPGAALGSGIFSALVWPFIAFVLVWYVVKGWLRRLAYRRTEARERAASRQVQRAAVRRGMKSIRRLTRAYRRGVLS